MTSISSSKTKSRIGDGGYSVDRSKGLVSPAILQWKDAIHREFLTLCRVPREKLTWLTILAGAVVVEAEPQSTVIGQMLDEFRVKTISRCRKKLPGMRIRGAFEVDVLHRWQVRDKTHKEAFLGSMGIDVGAVRGDQRILLPHLHAVVDRGGQTQDRIREEFSAEFPGPWRVLGRSLHTDKSVRENLTNLAGYSSKLKVAYSDWHPDRPTRFAAPYEDCWRKVIQEIVEGVGLSEMVFRHGGS